MTEMCAVPIRDIEFMLVPRFADLLQQKDEKERDVFASCILPKSHFLTARYALASRDAKSRAAPGDGEFLAMVSKYLTVQPPDRNIYRAISPTRHRFA